MNSGNVEYGRSEPIKRIEFQAGTEKQVKISTAGRIASLFYEGYRQGLTGVVEIIRASILYTQGCDCFYPQPYRYPNIRDLETHALLERDKNFYNYPNNLIVYSGGRGTGKSSAMLTFVDSLVRPDSGMFQRPFLQEMVECELLGILGKNEDDVDEAASMVYDLLHKSTFLSLAPIDPTMLENNAQILINILARMFQEAERAWERGRREQGNANDINEKNQLMQQFSTCYNCITAIKQKSELHQEFEGLDLLANLGDSSTLKRQMAKLVEKLLRFVVPRAGENSYLILQIDDTDMNIEQAYTILEDIRKYLVIPRLIIVLAADLDHLLQVVTSSMLKSYNAESFITQDVAREYIHSIANQYINKLIPQSRRISLPDIGIYLKEYPETEISYLNALREKILPDKQYCLFPDSQEQIFRLIYRKTGMIFLKHTNQLHYIIPDNMRQLNQFLAMLVQMSEVVNPDSQDAGFFQSDTGENARRIHLKHLQNRLQNVQRFRDYFLDVWVNNSLSATGVRWLREVASVNLAGKTRTVCNIIKAELYTSKEGAGTDSYADMIRWLRQWEKKNFSEQDKKTSFAFHIYFSLLGHTIALKRLISYYSTPKTDSGVSSWDCAFSRLYLLFGSRLFSYRTDQQRTENEQVMVTIPGTVANEKESFHICWRKKKGETLPEELILDPKILYSLFCEYELPEDEEAIWADFTTPILHTLYLGPNPDNLLTPLANKFQTFRVYQWLADWTVDNWAKIQSNSLLVVLNWDVQQKLEERLLPVVKGGSLPDTSAESGADFMKHLASFYDYLEQPFCVSSNDQHEERRAIPDPGLSHKQKDEMQEPIKAPQKVHLAIQCLENLKLHSWLTPLTLTSDAMQEGTVDDSSRGQEVDLAKSWESFCGKFYMHE